MGPLKIPCKTSGSMNMEFKTSLKDLILEAYDMIILLLLALLASSLMVNLSFCCERRET